MVYLIKGDNKDEDHVALPHRVADPSHLTALHCEAAVSPEVEASTCSCWEGGRILSSMCFRFLVSSKAMFNDCKL